MCVCVCVVRLLQLPEYIKLLKKSFVCIARNVSFTDTDGKDIPGREEVERKTAGTGREVKSANERERCSSVHLPLGR